MSFSLVNANAYTPATVTSITSTVCLKCGTSGRSGKPSCCGRGGSWFRNCGGAGNAKLDHTWQEGIRACKTRARFKRSIVKSKPIPGTIIFTSVNTSTTFTSPHKSIIDAPTSVSMADAQNPVSTLIISQTWGISLEITVYSSVLFIYLTVCSVS